MRPSSSYGAGGLGERAKALYWQEQQQRQQAQQEAAKEAAQYLAQGASTPGMNSHSSPIQHTHAADVSVEYADLNGSYGSGVDLSFGHSSAARGTAAINSSSASAHQPSAAAAGGGAADGETSQSATGSSAQAAGFQSALLEAMLDTKIEGLRDQMHRDVGNLHLEVLRQFEMQQHELLTAMEAQFASRFSELTEENKRLRHENELLKSTY
jgi:protein NEDD1